MASLGEDLAVTMSCAARHEAGHLAIAAANGLPLRADALMLDSRASGIACYVKDPDGKELFPERVCFATYAGYFAERHYRDAHGYPFMSADRFFLGSTDGGELNVYLRQIPPARLTDGDPAATGLRLRGEAELLVENHWPAIEELAAAVLAKDWESLKPLKSGGVWSRETAARYLPGAEAVEILERHGTGASWVAD